jgi:hypothetical protein
MSRPASDVDYSPPAQTASADEVSFLRLRSKNPIFGGKDLLPPVVLRIERGQFVVAHLGQGTQDFAPLTNRDGEDALGVAQPISCSVDFARSSAVAQFTSLFHRSKVMLLRNGH